jgi:acetyltransferase-like isoleucine patch superfamily enzyme
MKYLWLSLLGIHTGGCFVIKFLINNRKPVKKIKDVVKIIYRIPALFFMEFNLVISKLSGAVIDDFVCLERSFIDNAKNLRVGFGSFIAKDVHFALHGGVSIGRCCVVNSGVKILTASHYVNDHKWRMMSKKIILCDYSWVAMNAIILPGVTVGRGAVVGAGAVVREDVPDNCVVVGNPAKIIGKRIVSQDFEYVPAAFNSAVEAWIGDFIIKCE